MNFYKKELDRIRPDKYKASVVVSDSKITTKTLSLNREAIAEMRLFLDRIEELLAPPRQMLLHVETDGGNATTDIGYDEEQWKLLTDAEQIEVINEFTANVVNIYVKPEED